MTLKEQIFDAQKTAMKERDADRLQVLRLVTTAIKNKEIEIGKELDDDAVRDVIARQVKQTKDALSDFESAGRAELVEQTNKELVVLEAYLPAQLSDTELTEIVTRVIEQMDVTAPGDIGKVMGAVMKEVSGRADGNRVRAIVAQKLS